MSYLKEFEIKSFLKQINHNSQLSSNSNFPLISVVIASYNQAHFIERTLISIINQQYASYEIIVIDGNSTDNTIEVLKKFDKYISYWVSEKDNGQTHAINKGIAKATGDLICFQNSDDVFHPGCFDSIANAYRLDNAFDGYYGDLSIIDSNDNVTEILKTIPFNLKSQLLLGMQIFNQSYFFKKSSIEKFGNLDEKLRFVLDYEFVTRWACSGAKFKKVENAFGAFRIHEDSKTSNLEQVRVTELNETMSYYQNQMGILPKNKIEKFLLKLEKITFFLFKFDFNYLFHRINLK